MKLENLVAVRIKAVAPPTFKENLRGRDGALLAEDKIIRYFEYDMICKYGAPSSVPEDKMKLDPKCDLDCGNHRPLTCGAVPSVDKNGKMTFVPSEIFEVGQWYVPNTNKMDLLDTTKIKGLEKSEKVMVFKWTWIKEAA